VAQVFPFDLIFVEICCKTYNFKSHIFFLYVPNRRFRGWYIFWRKTNFFRCEFYLKKCMLIFIVASFPRCSLIDSRCALLRVNERLSSWCSRWWLCLLPIDCHQDNCVNITLTALNSIFVIIQKAKVFLQKSRNLNYI